MPPEGAHADHDYRGPANVLAQGTELIVDVVLRGHFQPIDGRFHWYGRIAPHTGIGDLVGVRKATVTLRTTSGEATATLSDTAPWDRHRIAGTGKPPFETATNPRPPASDASSEALVGDTASLARSADSMTSDAGMVRRARPVATIGLNRLEVRNAVDRRTASARAEAFRDFDADDDASVAVLHSEDGTFCAGADLKAISAGNGNRTAPDGDAPMGISRMRMSKPVTAAVDGHAVSGAAMAGGGSNTARYSWPATPPPARAGSRTAPTATAPSIARPDVCACTSAHRPADVRVRPFRRSRTSAEAPQRSRIEVGQVRPPGPAVFPRCLTPARLG